MSSDDFYLPLEDRQRIKKDKPFLRQRGPPGTHDLQLINEVINNLNSNNGHLKIPIFDKSLNNGEGDRSGFKIVEN